MKTRVLIPFLLCCGFISSNTLADFNQPEGEKLIFNEPDLEKWEVHQKDQIESKKLVWFNKDMRDKQRPFDDFFVFTIYNQSKNSLQHMRNALDAPGRRACDSFESIEIETISNQHYPSLFWHTVCLNNQDPEARMVHLAIKGEQHIYHLQKGWRGDVDPAVVEDWISRMEQSYVCDIRLQDRPCPSANTQVPEPDLKTETETETETEQNMTSPDNEQ